MTQSWNGSAWTTTAAWLPAVLGTPAGSVYPWTCVTPLPASAQMPPGQYVVQARGYDWSQNVGNAASNVVKLGDDVTAPNVAIAVPSATTLSSTGLTAASGTASDATVDGQDRSGLNYVQLRLIRVVDGVNQWWNPATHAWTTTNFYWTYSFTEAEALQSPASWSFTADLPSGADLPPGTYSLRATAADRTLNLTTAITTLTVVDAPLAPVNLTATAGDMQTDLAWQSNDTTYTAPGGYKVYRSTTDGGPYSLIAAINDGAARTYSDTAVTEGTTYYYVVKATNAAGDSPNSNQASAAPYLTSGPDAQVRTIDETALAGDNVYNTTGANQTKSGTSIFGATYFVKIENDDPHTGAPARTFLLQGDAGGAGWTVRYFLVPAAPLLPETDGEEITEGMTGEGEVSPALAPGASRLIRVQITSDTTVADNVTKTVKLTAGTIVGPSRVDTVALNTLHKHYIEKLKFSLDDGASWFDLDSEGNVAAVTPPLQLPAGATAGAPIEIEEGIILGLRAVKKYPELPWPFEPVEGILTPRWDKAGTELVGGDVYVLFAAAAEQPYAVTATAGNTLAAKVKVTPDPTS